MAAALHVGEERIIDLVSGWTDMDVEFGFPPVRALLGDAGDFWMRMQINYDAEMGKPEVVKELDTIIPYPHDDVSDAA